MGWWDGKASEGGKGKDTYSTYSRETCAFPIIRPIDQDRMGRAFTVHGKRKERICKYTVE